MNSFLSQVSRGTQTPSSSTWKIPRSIFLEPRWFLQDWKNQTREVIWSHISSPPPSRMLFQIISPQHTNSINQVDWRRKFQSGSTLLLVLRVEQLKFVDTFDEMIFITFYYLPNSSANLMLCYLLRYLCNKLDFVQVYLFSLYVCITVQFRFTIFDYIICDLTGQDEPRTVVSVRKSTLNNFSLHFLCVQISINKWSCWTNFCFLSIIWKKPNWFYFLKIHSKTNIKY